MSFYYKKTIDDEFKVLIISFKKSFKEIKHNFWSM